MNVCDNVGEHLVGNIYIKYRYEEDAGKAVDHLNTRFYQGSYSLSFPPPMSHALFVYLYSELP